MTTDIFVTLMLLKAEAAVALKAVKGSSWRADLTDEEQMLLRVVKAKIEATL